MKNWLKKQMNIYTCENCSFQFSDNEEFCPNCDVPVTKSQQDDEDSYICPVCKSKNSIGEHKCKYCCSLF